MVADRLRQHAMLLGTLDHPNILRAVEVGDAPDHGFFCVVEHTEGGCLDDRIRSGPLEVHEGVFIARAIASALQYARQRNVVQVDLSPRSVLLTGDNSPKLADFRPAGAGRRKKGEGKAITPVYAAPEEVSEFEDVDPTPATDVYRIGALSYAMLTGEAPFSWAGDWSETIRHVLEQPPVPVRQRNPAASADLEAVCLKCLEKQPTHRYGGPGDLVDILGKFLAGFQRRT